MPPATTSSPSSAGPSRSGSPLVGVNIAVSSRPAVARSGDRKNTQPTTTSVKVPRRRTGSAAASSRGPAIRVRQSSRPW